MTPWTATCQASLSFIISWSLLKFMSIELVMPSNLLNFCSLFALDLNLPQIRVFSSDWFITSGRQRIGPLASVLLINIQSWLSLRLTGLISLLSKGLSRIFSSTTLQKHQFFVAQSSLWSNPLIYTWLLEKPWLWLYGSLSAKWFLCFFNMLPKFVIYLV